MGRFLRVIFAVMITASSLPMVLLSQTADYNDVLVQARADLTAGHNEQALAGSQKAIGIDPSRWEAYLVAGSALENQKQFDPAIDNYSKALERVPGLKKAGVRSVLEQCMREKLTSTPSAEAKAPAATAQSPTFKDTLDWLISKNAQGGFTEGWNQGPDIVAGPFRFHSDFVLYSEGTQCVATLQGHPDNISGSATNSISINFSVAARNSVGVKRVNVRSLLPPPVGANVLTFPEGEIYFQITGLRPFWENWDQLTDADK
jgi:hypothetical protein